MVTLLRFEEFSVLIGGREEHIRERFEHGWNSVEFRGNRLRRLLNAWRWCPSNFVFNMVLR